MNVLKRLKRNRKIEQSNKNELEDLIEKHSNSIFLENKKKNIDIKNNKLPTEILLYIFKIYIDLCFKEDIVIQSK